MTPSDPVFIVERDYGPKLGTELMGLREHTRSKVVDLLAFEYRNAVKVLEIREDEHSVSDVTEEILADAAKARAAYLGVSA